MALACAALSVLVAACGRDEDTAQPTTQPEVATTSTPPADDSDFSDFVTAHAQAIDQSFCMDPPPTEAAEEACLDLVDLLADEQITPDEEDELDRIIKVLNREFGLGE